MRRIQRAEVELAIACSDVEHPGSKGPPGPRDIHSVRRDRIDATDTDRTAAIAQLKIAFVEDRLAIDELERRVSAPTRHTGSLTSTRCSTTYSDRARRGPAQLYGSR